MRYLSFQIVRNDIVKMNVDAIVNTANPKPVYGFGIDSAVYEAAGKDELLKIRQEIGTVERGGSCKCKSCCNGRLDEKNWSCHESF